MVHGLPDQGPLDVVALWRAFRAYLKVETEFGAPEEVERQRYGGQRTKYEGIRVKIKVTNTAPERPDWPQIVFLGVGIGIASIKEPSFFNRPRWAREIKRERTDSSPQASKGQVVYSRENGQEFPNITRASAGSVMRCFQGNLSCTK